jgi:tetratricopeptide (TPR) repeat protein
VLRHALPVVEERGESPDLARTTAWLASFLTFSGNASEAEPYSERSLILAQALGLPDVLCQALVTRGTILNFLGRYEEGLIHLEAAVAMARRHNLADQEQSALVNASDLFMVADAPQAAELAESAVAASRRRGDPYSETIAASNLMYVWLYQGEWARVEQMIADMTDSGERVDAALLHLRAALMCAWRGDVDGGRLVLPKLDRLRNSESMDDQVAVAAAEAAVANAAGDPKSALTHAQFVLDRLGTAIAVRHEALRVAWTEAIDAAFDIGDLAGAESVTALVGDLAPGLVPPYCRAAVHRSRARIAAETGDAVTARAAFGAAEDGFAELGHAYWLARTRLNHAEWLAATDGDRDVMAGLADAAAATFSTLGALTWAERANLLAEKPVASPVAGA